MRRIGQILSDSVPLTPHDVAEILEEQKVSRQRFGDAAVALGFAQPQQVWQAWVDQLRTSPEPIDLNTIQIDAQAARLLPGDLARQYRVVGVRTRGDDLVVAVHSPLSEDVILQMHAFAHKRLVFIRAAGDGLDAAIAKHYPLIMPEAA